MFADFLHVVLVVVIKKYRGLQLGASGVPLSSGALGLQVGRRMELGFQVGELFEDLAVGLVEVVALGGDDALHTQGEELADLLGN